MTRSWSVRPLAGFRSPATPTGSRRRTPGQPKRQSVYNPDKRPPGAILKRVDTVLPRYCYGVAPMWVAQLTDFAKLVKQILKLCSTALFSVSLLSGMRNSAYHSVFRRMAAFNRYTARLAKNADGCAWALFRLESNRRRRRQPSASSRMTSCASGFRVAELGLSAAILSGLGTRWHPS